MISNLRVTNISLHRNVFVCFLSKAVCTWYLCKHLWQRVVCYTIIMYEVLLVLLILSSFLHLLTVGGRHIQEAETYKEWNAADGFSLLWVSLLNDSWREKQNSLCLLGGAVCTEKLMNSAYPSVLGCVHTAKIILLWAQVRLGCLSPPNKLPCWARQDPESLTCARRLADLSQGTPPWKVLKFCWLPGDFRMGSKLSTLFAE